MKMQVDLIIFVLILTGTIILGFPLYNIIDNKVKNYGNEGSIHHPQNISYPVEEMKHFEHDHLKTNNESVEVVDFQEPDNQDNGNSPDTWDTFFEAFIMIFCMLIVYHVVKYLYREVKRFYMARNREDRNIRV